MSPAYPSLDPETIGISLFTLNYPPEPTGISTYTGSLAAGLADAGYKVTAHVAYPHYPQWKTYPGYGGWFKSELLDNVSVHRRRHFVPSPPRGLRRLLSELSFGVRLLFARTGSARLVIALSPPLFAIALMAVRLRLTRRRPRLIVWVQDLYSVGLAETGEGGGVVHSVATWVEKQTLRAADRVVVIHDRFADYVVGDLGVPAGKVAVIRNWTHLTCADVDSVDSHTARSSLHWPTNMTLVVHTGNMGAKQGLANIVNAARIADERDLPIHFVLVGDGGERRELEQSARGIKRISFIDPLSDEQYRLALAASDVLLVNEKPGISEMAMPSKLTSYFDAGRPVVAATDPAGITASEIGLADAGLVVDAGDAEALINALLSLREDPTTASRYGMNGRRHRAEFLEEATAIAQWRKQIHEVISQTAPR